MSKLTFEFTWVKIHIGSKITFFFKNKIINSKQEKSFVVCKNYEFLNTNHDGDILRGKYILKVRPHYAIRQNATHCSFAVRQKLLVS